MYDGLLLDAGGTLLQLARPVEATYASIGRKYGLIISNFCFLDHLCKLRQNAIFSHVKFVGVIIYLFLLGLVMSESEIKQGFRRAFAAPWPEKLRYEVNCCVLLVKKFPLYFCFQNYSRAKLLN